MAASERPSWESLFAAIGRAPRDDQAWSKLYTALWPYVLDWIVSRYGLDGSQAADVLQDAAIQYRDKLIAGKIAEPSMRHFRAFVRFCVLTALRARSRLVALDDIAPPLDTGDVESELYHKLIIDEALERMDQRCAYALRAKYFHGKTSAEIAESIGLDEGHVRVLLHRCREKCRELVLGLIPQLERV